MEVVCKMLFLNQDLEYRIFNSKIIPNISIDKIIGVRMPVIREIAKNIYNEEYIDCFLNELPHRYHEENVLHGIILTLKYNDIYILLNKLDEFLPYVDNWAVTDVISPKIFKKYPDIVYNKIKIWLNSEDEYVVRFGIVSLLQFYLDDNFRVEVLELVKNVDNNNYYVRMAIAWFYSFALIKQYDSTIRYFEEMVFDKWIHNKSIQKALDSYRIDDLRKNYLKSLKVK